MGIAGDIIRKADGSIGRKADGTVNVIRADGKCPACCVTTGTCLQCYPSGSYVVRLSGWSGDYAIWNGEYTVVLNRYFSDSIECAFGEYLPSLATWEPAGYYRVRLRTLHSVGFSGWEIVTYASLLGGIQTRWITGNLGEPPFTNTCLASPVGMSFVYTSGNTNHGEVSVVS